MHANHLKQSIVCLPYITYKSLAACCIAVLHLLVIYRFKLQLSIENICLILKSSPPLQINQAYLTLKFIESILFRAKQRRLPLKHLHIWDDRFFRNTKLYTFKLVPWSQIDSVAIKVTLIRSAATVRTRRRAVGWCRISTELTEMSTTNKAELPKRTCGLSTMTTAGVTLPLWTAVLSLCIIINGLIRLWGFQHMNASPH